MKRDLDRFFERNQHRFAANANTLFIDPPPGPFAALCAERETAPHAFFQRFDSYQSIAPAVSSARFGAFPEASPAWLEEIVLSLPREKALLSAWLAWAVTALSPGGTLWLLGENRAGARSAGKLLASFFAEVDKIDSARHCVLLRCQKPVMHPRFDQESLYSTWDFAVAGQPYRAASIPGVFAHGRLDEGTLLLLEAVADSAFSGHALDFGCGAGVIAAVMLKRNPGLSMTLCDINALALTASQRTLGLNGVEGRILPSDGLCELDCRFDTVVTNPPFHRGVHTDSGMSMALLAPVRNFLAERGQLIVVSNRHLPYQKWLLDLFGNHQTLAQNARFQVHRAENRSF